MNIVIFGSKGQLGRDCSEILAEKHNITHCDRPQVDIGRLENIDTCIASSRPDVVINCAAYTAVDGCEKETALCWRVNAEGPEHLAEASHRYGFRLIHISTDYVFDGILTPPDGYRESDLPNPLSAYGRSKLAGEQAILKHAANALILRTAWLYSRHGRNFLKTILRLTLQEPHRPLKVVNDQHGSLTWSRSLALQIERLLESDLRGVAHATSEGHCTWYEGARYFLETMGVPHTLQPCTTAEYPTPAKRPSNSILINSRLEAVGISTFVDWRRDIDAFVQEFREELLRDAANQGR